MINNKCCLYKNDFQKFHNRNLQNYNIRVPLHLQNDQDVLRNQRNHNIKLVSFSN